MSSELSIEVRDLAKCYRIYKRPHDRLLQMLSMGRIRRFHEFWALRDVSFDVKKGESIGIVGTNGSGKSTLLQIICGTVAPTAGHVTVNGRISALLELGAGFNTEFSGRDNVFLNAAILGLSDDETRERYEEIVRFADIGAFIDEPVKTYSSGMFVRLAFAVAVNVDPDILVVDEALAVGDNLFQKRCFQKLEELMGRGVTLLFVSHDQETVRSLTNRALLLDNGRPVLFGGSGEVILEYRRLLHQKESAYFASLVREATAASKAAEPVPQEAGADARRGAVGRRSEELSFGDGDAELMGLWILDEDGAESSLFYPRDLVRFRIRVKVRKEMSGLNVGLRIRNKQGVKVYSWGTFNQDLSIWAGTATGEVFWDRSFAAGDEVEVELATRCNLGVDFYEVQTYVTEELDPVTSKQRMIEWRDEVGFFQVSMKQKEYFFGGLCDMAMSASVVEHRRPESEKLPESPLRVAV